MAVDTERPVIVAGLVQQHLDRVSDLLGREKADGLFVFHAPNIRAFCGVPLAPSDRLVCGLINRGGQVALVVPAFEAGMANTLPPGSELVAWEEHENPYAAVAKAADLLGLTSGRILVDGHTWTKTATGIRGSLPAAALRRDPGVIEAVRISKSPEAIEAVRAACCDTGQIYPLVTNRLQAGISERELSRDVRHSLEGAGLLPWGDLIQGGESAAMAHQPAGARVFQTGDAVVVDFVCEKDSYFGDMTRTFALGAVSEEIKRAYAVVRDAQRTAMEAIRPGATCESVDRAARSVIERAGLDEFFVHRLGHGIGLEVHEPPFLVRGNQQRLQPGMCVTVEPGVYVPGQFGIRIEDVVAVTADGHEVLSSSTPTDVSSEFSNSH